METIVKKLSKIQRFLVARKSQFNKFGKYYYRNAEDILESLKPLVYEENCSLLVDEEVLIIQDKLCMKSTVKLTDGKEHISCTGLAFIDLEKKGMSSEQATGAASSYAKKYALGNLFAIDDNKDADSQEPTDKEPEKPKAPELNPNHPKWKGAIKALKENETTIEKIKEVYFLTEASEKLLIAAIKTYEKLG
jgi:hypothetical protein